MQQPLWRAAQQQPSQHLTGKSTSEKLHLHVSAYTVRAIACYNVYLLRSDEKLFNTESTKQHYLLILTTTNYIIVYYQSQRMNEHAVLQAVMKQDSV